MDAISESRRLHIYDRTSNCRFLIDTGSDVSIIPATRKERLRGPTSFRLHAANGTTIKTYESRFLTTDLGLRRRFCWNFLVADVGTAIIGADFLAFFGILVDLKNRCLIDNKTKLHSIGGLVSTCLYGITTINIDHPFRDLLHEYRDITLPSTMREAVKEREVKHYIVTKGPPVTSKARRLATDKLEAAKKEFKVMSELRKMASGVS